MPKGNKYWQRFYEKGIHTVSDNTRPMMVHLTREYMLDNDITVAGNESDFAILTGTPYQEGTAYVFKNRVIKGDVTCQNGYIHQMEDVLVPPGNMAQVLRKHDNTKYFSRIIDHYSKPIYDESTPSTTTGPKANRTLALQCRPLTLSSRYATSVPAHRMARPTRLRLATIMASLISILVGTNTIQAQQHRTKLTTQLPTWQHSSFLTTMPSSVSSCQEAVVLL